MLLKPRPFIGQDLIYKLMAVFDSNSLELVGNLERVDLNSIFTCM